jgi:hypothetical protein
LQQEKAALKNDWETLSVEERMAKSKRIKQIRQEILSMPSFKTDDANYRRIIYCRYADDFLIGVIGPKAEAEQVKADVGKFLLDKLHLELSIEKTHITHCHEMVRFLGYDLTCSEPAKEFVKKANGAISRRPTGYVKLYVPREKWQNSLLKKGALWIKKDKDGKESWMPVARKNLVYKTPVQIVNIYNAEIRGLYNYYAIAGNVSVLNKFCYVMEYSMYKTLACKFRCSMVKAKKMYLKNGKFSIPFTNAKGNPNYVTFYNNGFCKKRINFDSEVDVLPQEPKYFMYASKPKELVVRMLQKKCELCGEIDEKPQVYQVKQLTDLKPNVEWEAKMISKRRKTLVVCQHCYKKIHADI